MGMKIDTGKARKALYGITMGMTNQELRSIQDTESIRLDPYGRTQGDIKRCSRSRQRRKTNSEEKESMSLLSKKNLPWSGKKLQIGLKSMLVGRNEVEECF